MKSLEDVIEDAGNPETEPKKLALIWSLHQHPEVVEALARNPSTPSDVLLALSDSDEEVGIANLMVPLAANPNSPPSLFDEIYAEYAHEYFWDDPVLQALASNPSVPKEILVKLAQNPEVGVMTKCELADNPSCPPEVMVHLAKHHDPHVRESAAVQEITPAEVLRELMQDEESFVAEAAKETLASRSEIGDVL